MKRIRSFAIRMRTALMNPDGAEYIAFLIIALIVVIVGALLLTAFKDELTGANGIVTKLFAKIKAVFADGLGS